MNVNVHRIVTASVTHKPKCNCTWLTLRDSAGNGATLYFNGHVDPVQELQRLVEAANDKNEAR